MKVKLSLLISVLVLIMSNLACSAGEAIETAYSADTHFQGATGTTETVSTHPCPDFAEKAGVGPRCYLTSQDFIPGTIENPARVKIESFTAGQVMLNDSYISASYGLDWFDGDTLIDISDMEEGVFYRFEKVGITAWFDLVDK